MKETYAMKNIKSDVMWGLIAVIVVMFFLTGKVFVFSLIGVVILAIPSLGRDESQYWENRPHDDEEPEQEYIPERKNERSAFSLRVDESQFWENRPHDDEEEPVQTDYSQVDPCFLGDKKKRF